MPEYKLTYFDLRALGEPIRWTFRVAGVQFEDNRIPPETWEQVKNTIDWGQVPYLEIDGTIKITQSVAISRYLAKKFDLVPSNELEQARCDEFVDAIQDFRLKIKPYFLVKQFGNSAEKANELRKDLDGQIPIFLGQFEALVQQSDGDFILGEKFYWADFWLANFLEIWEETFGSDFLNLYPNLKKQREAVLAIPQIKKWCLTRPKTFV